VSDPRPPNRSPLVRVVRAVAGNRDLLRAELAYSTFNVAEWSTWLAMLVFAYERGGATTAGVLATVLLVPAAIGAAPLAAFCERLAPADALAAGYAAQAATSALVAVAMAAHAPTVLVYVLLAGPSVAFTMTRPVQAAVAPRLAHRPEELTAANVVTGWIESVSTLAAPLLVGVLLTFSPPWTLFALAAVTCSAGAVLVWQLRRTAPQDTTDDEDEEMPRESFTASVAFVRREPNARALVLLLFAQSAALGALDILYVELAQGVLHRGGNWAGYLNAATGVGSVLAVLVTAHAVGRPRLALPLVASLVCWTVALFGLGATHTAALMLALLAAVGGAQSTFNVTARTLLQRMARADLLARVFGMLEGLEMVGLAVGSLLAPILIAIGGASVALVGVGLLLPLAALPVGRRLLDIDRHANVPVVEIALLRSLRMFSLLPPATLESLARALELLTVEADVDVIVQGDDGDLFYVIAEGDVDVVIDGARIATLGRGAAFGEIALMHDVPRTATVRTRTAARFYTLERDAFLGGLTSTPAAYAALQRLAERRLGQQEELRRSGSAVL
jgi:Na+/melibiose symporter-like transporter